jgi:hypothetical protein
MISTTVKVNGVNTIEIEVVNAEPTGPQNVAIVYNVRAKGRDFRGYPYEFEFDVLHWPSAGLPGLMRNVFLELEERVK